MAFPQAGTACSVSHHPDNAGGGIRERRGRLGPLRCGRKGLWKQPCPRTPTLTSNLGGHPSKFTVAPHLGLFLSLCAISRLSQKVRKGRGALWLPPEAGVPPPKGKNDQRLYVFASRGAGGGGPGGRIQEDRLLLASVHLGFHKQRLPLLCGPQHPLLLPPEVFLLGQQHFLGVHTCLQGENNCSLDLFGGGLPPSPLSPIFSDQPLWPSES